MKNQLPIFTRKPVRFNTKILNSKNSHLNTSPNQTRVSSKQSRWQQQQPRVLTTTRISTAINNKQITNPSNKNIKQIPNNDIERKLQIYANSNNFLGSCRSIDNLRPLNHHARFKSDLPCIQTLKAEMTLKKYNIIDSPEVIYKVSEILSQSQKPIPSSKCSSIIVTKKCGQVQSTHNNNNNPDTLCQSDFLTNLESTANSNIRTTLLPSQSRACPPASLKTTQAKYSYQVNQRFKYKSLMEQVLSHIKTVQEKPEAHMVDIVQFKQELLTRYFNQVVSHISEECFQRGSCLNFLWKNLIHTIQTVLNLLSNKLSQSESQNLTEQSELHNAYQKVVSQYKKQSDMLHKLAEEKQDFINNLVFNLRYKRREVKKLYAAIKSGTEKINEYKRYYIDLEKEHIDLQMQVKDISKETAIFLVERKKILNREKDKSVKLAPQKKKIKHHLLKKMQTENPADVEVFVNDLQQNYKLLKPEKGNKFLINDQLDEAAAKMSIQGYTDEFMVEDETYGFVHYGTSMREIVPLMKEIGVGSTVADKYIHNLWTDSIVQVDMSPKTVDIGVQDKFVLLEVVPRVLSFKYCPPGWEKKHMPRQSEKVQRKSGRKTIQETGMSVHSSDKLVAKKTRTSTSPKTEPPKHPQETEKNNNSTNSNQQNNQKQKHLNHMQTQGDDSPPHNSSVHNQGESKFKPHHSFLTTRPIQEIDETLEKDKDDEDNVSFQELIEAAPISTKKPAPKSPSRWAKLNFSTEEAQVVTELKKNYLAKALESKIRELKTSTKKTMRVGLIARPKRVELNNLQQKKSDLIESVIQEHLKNIKQYTQVEIEVEAEIEDNKVVVDTRKEEEIFNCFVSVSRSSVNPSQAIIIQAHIKQRIKRISQIYESAYNSYQRTGHISELTSIIYDHFSDHGAKALIFSNIDNSALNELSKNSRNKKGQVEKSPPKEQTQLSSNTNSERAASFLAYVSQHRHISISFYLLCLLSGTLVSNPYSVLICKTDFLLFLKLLYGLNCNSQTRLNLDNIYTTLEVVRQKTPVILRQFLSHSLAESLTKDLLHVIEGPQINEEQNFINSANQKDSSPLNLRMHLEKTLKFILQKILEMRLANYNSLTALISVVNPQANDYMDIGIFAFLCRLNYSSKLSFIQMFKKFSESAPIKTQGHCCMLLQTFTYFCLKQGFPSFVDTLSYVESVMISKPLFNLDTFQYEEWSREHAYLREQLQRSDRYTFVEAQLCEYVEICIKQRKIERLNIAKKLYELLMFEVLEAQAQKLLVRTMGSMLTDIYGMTLLSLG